MKMTSLYKKAMKEAKEKDEVSRMRCLRTYLEREIGEDVDKYLLYKGKSRFGCDFGRFGFCLSAVGIMIALLAAAGAAYFAFVSLGKAEEAAVNFMITQEAVINITRVIEVCILMMTGIAGYSCYALGRSVKYHRMNIVLDYIGEKFTPQPLEQNTSKEETDITSLADKLRPARPARGLSGIDDAESRFKQIN